MRLKLDESNYRTGWENPFPSGSSRVEFLDIQTEFALAQKCSMAIVGESNYAEKILAHMCCGFPLNQRGVMPHRCVCPPYVQIEQAGFDCKKGNPLSCANASYFNKGGDIVDVSSVLAANISITMTAFISSTNVHLRAGDYSVMYTPKTSPDKIKFMESAFAEKAKEYSCATYDNGPTFRTYC